MVVCIILFGFTGAIGTDGYRWVQMILVIALMLIWVYAFLPAAQRELQLLDWVGLLIIGRLMRNESLELRSYCEKTLYYQCLTLHQWG